MAPDLTPLEQAAARVGLPGLKARVVPHDRRRGWWFRWGGGELLVSDRVIDRCAPADACALLCSEVIRARTFRRQWDAMKAIAIVWPAILIVAAIARAPDSDMSAGALWWVAGGMLIASALLYVALRIREARVADDQTVALLGDATPLVRGLNEMDFEELHIAGRVLPARPDLHRRAERLVRLHRLCEAQPPA